jgi:cytochrome P450
MVRQTVRSQPDPRFRPEPAQGIATMGAIAAVQAFRRDPLGFYTEAGRQPGGMARFRLPGLPGKDVVVITHPDHVHHVLKENHQNYDKNAVFYNNARPFLGNGLPLTHGGEDWRRRRRLMQPAFHRQHLHVVTDVTQQVTAGTLESWDRAARAGEPLDLSLDMTKLTMRIMCRILFGVDVLTDAAGLAHRFERISAFAIDHLTMPFPPLSVPTRRNRTFHADVRYVSEFVNGLVRARQADPRRHDDLLDLLVHAGTDTGDEGLARQQLQDALISMFFAGHDTTAHTLAWAWYLLGRNRAASDRLRSELGSVLGGRPATADDLPELSYTRMVLTETLRLYPPVWAWMRRAIGADHIGGHRIAPNSLITWSPYVGNRLPDVWDAPESFQPERHDDGPSAAGRLRHAALPFGEGPRMCIGSDFAMAEASLILATLAQHHRPELIPGRPVTVGTGITLHPEDGIWARLR